MRIALVGLLVCSLTATALPQSNTVDGLDGFMNDIGTPTIMGRMGMFPSGTNGIAFATTLCNTGTVGIIWKAPMKPRHPLIASIVAREVNGRFEQISDRSWVKHNFAAGNTSTCSSCTDNSDSSVLAVGCSDTYGSAENGDRYWLGPPSEIDPWLGTWDPNCSYFDQGDPPVPPPDDCDGVRSLDQGMVDQMDPVEHRIVLSDADLSVTGAQFYYWAAYVIRGEAEALRDDTSVSRTFVPTWNGSRWNLDQQGGKKTGSILRRWAGATVKSNTNGGDDGRVFLASKVTGPDTGGIYHYEYAMNNRDNARAIGSLRIPINPGASITNAGFRDIDADPTNDWTFQTGAAEVTWSTSTNPVEWNTIYNFWFDSDVPPASVARSLVSEFHAGAGLDAFYIDTEAPMGPALGTDLGFGMAGGNGLEPYLSMSGSVDIGQKANVMVRHAAPGALAFVFLADQNGAFQFRGGVIVPFPPDLILAALTDGSGQILASFDGLGGSFDVFAQLIVVDPASAEQVAMTNALEIVH